MGDRVGALGVGDAADRARRRGRRRRGSRSGARGRPSPWAAWRLCVAKARDTEPTIVILPLTGIRDDGADHLAKSATRWPGSDRTSGACGRSATGCGRCTGAGQRAARAPDRRADQDRPLPAHQRPQPRPRLRGAARALPDLGGGARRAGRRGRGGDPARRPGASRRRRGSRRSSSSSASSPTSTGPRTAPREESLEFLLSLPGVGRKTAACVLIFTWGIPEIPVDVHVHRVGGRLGLFPAKASFENAHDEMLAIVAARGRLRAAHEPDPPRARALPPEAALRRVRRCGGCAPGTAPESRSDGAE